MESGEPVLVTGKLEHGEEPKLLASTAEPLTEVRARMTREVQFRVEVAELQGKTLTRFIDVLKEQRGGCRSRLVLRSKGAFEADLLLPDWPVEPSPRLEESMQALFERAGVVALS